MGQSPPPLVPSPNKEGVARGALASSSLLPAHPHPHPVSQLRDSRAMRARQERVINSRDSQTGECEQEWGGVTPVEEGHFSRCHCQATYL